MSTPQAPEKTEAKTVAPPKKEATHAQFVFIGDQTDARRGPLPVIDDQTGEEVEGKLHLMGYKFMRKAVTKIPLKDEVVIRKLRGNNHFRELKPGDTLEGLLASLPRASKERRPNIDVSTLGVAKENSGNGKKRTKADPERDAAEMDGED